MKKLAKLFLLISVASFTVGLTGPGSEILHGGLKPIGAIAFIAFFITNLLSREFESYDLEESAKTKLVRPEAKPGPKGHGIPQHA